MLSSSCCNQNSQLASFNTKSKHHTLEKRRIGWPVSEHQPQALQLAEQKTFLLTVKLKYKTTEDVYKTCATCANEDTCSRHVACSFASSLLALYFHYQASRRLRKKLRTSKMSLKVQIELTMPPGATSYMAGDQVGGILYVNANQAVEFSTFQMRYCALCLW